MGIKSAKSTSNSSVRGSGLTRSGLNVSVSSERAAVFMRTSHVINRCFIDVGLCPSETHTDKLAVTRGAVYCVARMGR
jgi:hypothetical protein